MTDNFHKWNIGDSVKLIRIISSKDVDNFSELTGDTNPLHMDDGYAKKTSFKGRVVHGMLSASFISTIIGTKLPGKGALWISQTLNFRFPARVGDKIAVSAIVKNKSRSQRVLILDILVKNQHKQILISGEAKVKVVELLEQENKIEKRKNKAAIITGASNGIGAAIALKLAHEGYPIVINYHNSKEKAEELLHKIKNFGGNSILYQGNVSNSNDVDKMVSLGLKSFGGIDILVNNAGGPVYNKSFNELLWSDIKNHFNTHVKGAYNTCKSIIPIMQEQGYGRIVNITSISIDGTPPAQNYDYLIAKSALSSLTKSLAVEYSHRGITVNNVAPGMTETNLLCNLPEKTKIIKKMQTPLRRLATPNDIANVVSALVSEAGDYITGETIRVCGGQLMI